MKIKFSHDYPKLHCQKSAQLLKVEVCSRRDLSEAFVEYDTVYTIEHAIGVYSEEVCGHYELPNGRLIVLVFFGDKFFPFTTVRRWTEEKERYYRECVGKQFEIELLPQTEERAKTTPNSGSDATL